MYSFSRSWISVSFSMVHIGDLIGDFQIAVFLQGSEGVFCQCIQTAFPGTIEGIKGIRQFLRQNIQKLFRILRGHGIEEICHRLFIGIFGTLPGSGIVREGTPL